MTYIESSGSYDDGNRGEGTGMKAMKGASGKLPGFSVCGGAAEAAPLEKVIY
jgi:hypothetical protein